MESLFLGAGKVVEEVEDVVQSVVETSYDYAPKGICVLREWCEAIDKLRRDPSRAREVASRENRCIQEMRGGSSCDQDDPRQQELETSSDQATTIEPRVNECSARRTRLRKTDPDLRDFDSHFKAFCYFCNVPPALITVKSLRQARSQKFDHTTSPKDSPRCPHVIWLRDERHLFSRITLLAKCPLYNHVDHQSKL